MSIFGIMRQPRASSIAIATVAAGALVYHFRIRSRALQVE
jgi:hypothetical protein